MNGSSRELRKPRMARRSSLESLVDEMADEATHEQKERVGSVYRRLSGFFA